MQQIKEAMTKAVGSEGLQNHFFTSNACAELQGDGSVVVWGNPENGGNCSKVQEQLISGVQSLQSTNGAFAALKSEGSVLTWGNDQFGGEPFVCVNYIS